MKWESYVADHIKFRRPTADHWQFWDREALHWLDEFGLDQNLSSKITSKPAAEVPKIGRKSRTVSEGGKHMAADVG
jgi:hypothetical protein